MSRGWHWKAGDWWCVCDVCGFNTRASDIKKRWDGMLVCSADFEPRHEQDFLKVRQERIGVPFSRPDPEETFITVSYVTVYVDDNYVDDNYFEEL